MCLVAWSSLSEFLLFMLLQMNIFSGKLSTFQTFVCQATQEVSCAGGGGSWQLAVALTGLPIFPFGLIDGVSARQP